VRSLDVIFDAVAATRKSVEHIKSEIKMHVTITEQEKTNRSLYSKRQIQDLVGSEGQ
jgi:hypothetical protein